MVTFGIDVKNMRRDLLVITFDTNCDGRENYVLSVYSDGSVELDRIGTTYQMFQMRGPTVVRRRSRETVGATTYSFRLASGRFGGMTAFRFEAHVDTPKFADVSDQAPDDGHWYYDLLSR